MQVLLMSWIAALLAGLSLALPAYAEPVLETWSAGMPAAPLRQFVHLQPVAPSSQ